MTWRDVAGQEPSRSRLLIVVGGVLSTAGAAALIWAAGARSSWWLTAVSGTWLVLLLAIAVVGFSVGIRAMSHASRHARPTRFVLTNHGFGIAPLLSPGLVSVSQMIVSGYSLTMLLVAWRPVEHPGSAEWTLFTVFAPVMTALVVLTMLTAVASAVFAWRGFAMELTPAGVYWRSPLLRRVVPWGALAPGGPPRPQISANRLHLVVARPELVVQRGWALGFGPPQRPVVPLQVDMHPWLLADAIRWYAEHPADRTAIGTHTEHQRLIAELTGSRPEYRPSAGARLPRPPVVRVAGWLTYTAVMIGILGAAANLVIAIVFDDRLVAAERAMAAEEERITGEPVGDAILGAADFAKASAIVALVLAMVVGVAAIVLVRASMRGSDHARIGLVVIAGLVALWAVCPCGPPTLMLTDVPDAPMLGGALLMLWMLQRGAMLALTTAVVVLLLLPTASRYFRPIAIEQPRG
jgi:hypothetical protein